MNKDTFNKMAKDYNQIIIEGHVSKILEAVKKSASTGAFSVQLEHKIENRYIYCVEKQLTSLGFSVKFQNMFKNTVSISWE